MFIVLMLLALLNFGFAGLNLAFFFGPDGEAVNIIMACINLGVGLFVGHVAMRL